LRPPCCKRICPAIAFRVGVKHVAHRDSDGIQFILDAEQLQRIFAIPIDQIALQFTQTGYAPRDVPGVAYDGQKRNDEADVEGRRRGSAWGWHSARI
jgi:hypothetical protein